MIVVKVGGSLFDHPALGSGLRALVDSLAPAEVLLVPGGGPVADAVRTLDRVHDLGEAASHWLALRALDTTAALVAHFMAPGVEQVQRGTASDPPTFSHQIFSSIPGSRVSVLRPLAFAREDETRPDSLPHTWDVTTDSISARAACVLRAERLVLLKSVHIPPGTPWPLAAANGWVDPHFPRLAATLSCPIECITFRRWIEAHVENDHH